MTLHHGESEPGVNKRQLSKIRHHLGKTQNQMASLLGTSLKAMQSFEQGWRDIPIHTERQVLLLLALKDEPQKKSRPCWVVRKCSQAHRKACPAWEFRAGHLCWFINGTFCNGQVQDSWQEKMKTCSQCEVFRRTFHILDAL
jgi:DNA-binding XRE family transcriptional regulator